MAASHYQNIASSVTESINFDDAPKFERSLVLSLHSRSLWDQFKEAVHELDPMEILKRLNKEKERIIENVEKRGHITEDEAEFLNREIKEALEESLEKFKKQALKQLKIQSGDKPEQVKFKTDFSNGLLNWLTNLFSWLIGKIEAILSRICDSLTWCWEQTRNLFNYLFGLFKFSKNFSIIINQDFFCIRNSRLLLHVRKYKRKKEDFLIDSEKYYHNGSIFRSSL